MPEVRDEARACAPWTARLEVFEQDFDTAMAIWSVEDAVVGRLCADEQPVTRRRSRLSSSQVEFSQLSESSQRESRPMRSKKRRRTATQLETSQAREAPPPPLFHCSPDLSTQTQDLGVTQLLSTQDEDAARRVADRDAGYLGGDTLGPTLEAEFGSNYSTPSKQAGDETFSTPTDDRRAERRKFAPVASSLSDADVVQESPMDTPSINAQARSVLHHTSRDDHLDDYSTMCSSFTTGSGQSVMISKKRLRDVEEDWLSDEQGNPQLSSKIVTSSLQEMIVISRPLVTGFGSCDSSSAIDPRRLSFSTTDDEGINSRSGFVGFQTGSGRKVELKRESLSKYEAILFGNEDSAPAGIGVGHRQELHETKRLESGSLAQPLTPHAQENASTAFNKQETNTPIFNGDTNGDDHGIAKAITGFQTGAGRKVAVSQERLAQYADLVFKSHDDSRSTQEPKTFESCAHQSAQSAVPSVLQGVYSSSATGASVSGFQTASGRAVAISEERLKEIEERLFGESSASGVNLNDVCSDLTQPIYIRSASFTPVISRGERESDDDPSTVPSGFKTGGGSSIRISRERLKDYERQAMPVMANTSTEGHIRQPVEVRTSPKAVLAGFTTGNGGPISVSQERLRMYEKMHNDDDDEAGMSPAAIAPEHSLRSDVMEPSTGFLTASGAKVAVSEKLQEYAPKCRAESHGQSPDQPAATRYEGRSDTCGAFTTGNGRPITISEDKLREYEDKLVISEESWRKKTTDDSHGCQDEENDFKHSLKHADVAQDSVVVLAGFATGSGRSVSVSQEKLQEYQNKISQAYADEDTIPFTNRKTDEQETSREIKMAAQTSASQQRNPQIPSGRPPRYRHSIGAANPTVGVDIANRRHSFPSRSRPRLADDSAGSAVSSGVIQRLAIAHQTSKRASVLDDVSNIPRAQSRVSRLNGGGKWKPPSQLREIQSGGYSTPAKARSAAPQSLSAKKGFRPPVPMKTPPSKALISATATPPQKVVDILGINRPPQIEMPFREAMRISYKLLALDTDTETHSFTSEHRASLLRQIVPELSVSVAFSAHTGELVDAADCGMSVTLPYLMQDMKSRGFLGSEVGVTNDWFRNQYRWAVWKLATMELQFPRFLFGRYLTKEQIMYEICKRYRRDVVLAQRSIVKKILNRDANAASCMVLRIAGVVPFPVEEEKEVDIIPPPHWKLALVLTDGWHAIYAVPDQYLAEALWKHHKANQLIGKKVVTWSATLHNINDGVDPLECALATEQKWENPLWAGKNDPSKWPYLKLHFNSTRPVIASAKLGLESLIRRKVGRQSDTPYDFVMLKSIPLHTMEVGGGIVRSVRVRVTRVSPVLHLQSKDFSVGPRILCEEQMPQYFQVRQDYLQARRSEDESSDDDSSPELPLPVPFVKLEVECAHVAESPRKCYAVLTMWRPGDEMLSKIKEGGVFYASSLSVNWKVDYGHQGVFMRLGTTKGSTFEKAESSDDKHLSVQNRVCQSVDNLVMSYRQHSTMVPKEKKLYGDVCVVIVRCEDARKSTDQRADVSSTTTSTDHIFVTDPSGRLMSVRLHSTRVRVRKPAKLDEAKISKQGVERVFTRGNKKLWSEGNVVCISGLEISHYDDKLDILDCDLSESAQIVSLPSKKSHFFEAHQRLRELLSSREASTSEAQQFASTILRLKKYVDRSILHLDFEPSQDEVHDIDLDDDNEVYHLTQELNRQPEEDVNYWMSQAPFIHVEGVVTKILLLSPSDPLASACDAIALAYIQTTSDDEDKSTLYAIYLTTHLLSQTRTLLSDNFDRAQSSVSATKSAATVLRFEAQWETSERLLNSWKPWVRDGGATFLLASAVASGTESETL